MKPCQTGRSASAAAEEARYPSQSATDTPLLRQAQTVFEMYSRLPLPPSNPAVLQKLRRPLPQSPSPVHGQQSMDNSSERSNQPGITRITIAVGGQMEKADVGHAQEAFFGAGMMDLTPGTTKSAKKTRTAHMVIVDLDGAVEVNLDGYHLAPLQDFRIAKGGMFQVPRENTTAPTGLEEGPSKDPVQI
ncbi:MAG: hypothetical protein Q9180_007001 [Flavoplaca navasiana]